MAQSTVPTDHPDGSLEAENRRPVTGNGELDLRVEGMHCAGCVARVRKTLENQPGVSSADVNLNEGRAHVAGDDLDVDHLITAVRDSGYDAEAIEEGESPAEQRSEIEQRQRASERAWRRRALIGLVVWVPMAILHWTGAALDWHGIWLAIVMFVAATVVVGAAGGGFYRSAWNAAKKRTTNMDTLIAMGATAAYGFSIVVFIAQRFGWLMDQPSYFIEAAGLLTLISLGHWMEARASSKAGSAVRELLELQPDQAEIIDAQTGETEKRPSSEVRPDQRLLIRPGSAVPVDGVVEDGASEVDESVVTGEAMPVNKQPGDTVAAGTMNTTGRLVIRATVDGRHTTVSRIAEIVRQAQSSRAEIQALADRVSAVFVPVVLTIAAITIIGWSIFGDVATAIIAAVTVLIISCPCALGLATPMAVMVGTGSASKRGVLIKDAQTLERTAEVTHIIFDKTGTLTVGRPTVGEIYVENNALDENELLRLAASVEAPSEHPIAQAIYRAATDRELKLSNVEDFEALPGEGVQGRVDGKWIVVRRDSEATCQVLIDDQRAGTMTVSDALRPDAKRAIDQLKARGLRVTMLSGDRPRTANEIGAELGLDEQDIVADQSPEAKAAFVRDLKNERPDEVVLMVGDGINDAAALAEADIGVAMASGTNIAIESADIVIPGDQVMAIPQTLHLSQHTLTTIKQNLFFAFIYNICAIPAAAFGLLGMRGPLIAAAAMALSDITVIGNALRLKARLTQRREQS